MPRRSATRRARPTSLDRLKPFEDDCVMVVIETPKGSPNKLAFEPRYGTFVLKGVLPAGAVFPFDFGFVPSTRADDGDPLDVLVFVSYNEMKGKRFQVKGQAGKKRALALVDAALTKRGRR